MKTTKTTKNNIGKTLNPVGADFFERLWDESWTYIKNVVDAVREPVLILDKDFRVMVANEPFYRTFQVEPKDTENKVVYDLGNGQWDIPALKKLLEDILPKNAFFKGFEVAHDFPFIGRKVMILNARRIYFKQDLDRELLPPPIIVLAIEDVTEMMAVAETLTNHATQLEARFNMQTEKMVLQIAKLEKEIKEIGR